MSWLYNRAFKVGVAVTIVLFAIVNILSYTAAQRSSDIEVSGIAPWGFPFSWTPGGDPLALIVNFAVIAISSLAVGFLFRDFLGKRN